MTGAVPFQRKLLERKVTVVCSCFFCNFNKEHPDDRHPNFHAISDRLLKAESLDPKDSIPMEACKTCGHRRDKKVEK